MKTNPWFRGKLSLFLLTLLAYGCQKDPVFVSEGFDTGMRGTIRGLDMVNDQVVWISGTQGNFCVTVDGGESWFQDQVVGADSLDFRDVHGFSATEAVLMSAGPGDQSRIYLTSDGGKSWRLTHTNTDSLGFFDGFDFDDEGNGVLFSDPVDAKLNLLITKDYGESWVRFHPELLPTILPGEYAFAASGTSLTFDPSGGIWLATGGSVARIWHTPALGKAWTQWETPAIQGQAAEGLFSIAARSAIRVVAVGGNYQQMDQTGQNVVRLKRAGTISWENPQGAAEVPFMECVRWISNYALLACGPTGVWMSGDNGLTWREVSSEQGFHTLDVHEKTKTAWVAGQAGKVQRLSW